MGPMLKNAIGLRRERTVERYALDVAEVGDHAWVVRGDLLLFDGERLQAFCCPDCHEYLIRIVLDNGSLHMGPELVCPAETKVLDEQDDSGMASGNINEQRSPQHREQREIVAAEVGKLSSYLERIGMDSAKASIGKILEAMMKVARLHPDESVRTQYGNALLGLWAAISTCHRMLAEMNDDNDDDQQFDQNEGKVLH